LRPDSVYQVFGHVEIDGEEHLILQENDILGVIEK